MYTVLHCIAVLYMGQADVWNVLLHNLLNINIELIGCDGLAVKTVHAFNACLLGTLRNIQVKALIPLVVTPVQDTATHTHTHPSNKN